MRKHTLSILPNQFSMREMQVCVATIHPITGEDADLIGGGSALLVDGRGLIGGDSRLYRCQFRLDAWRWRFDVRTATLDWRAVKADVFAMVVDLAGVNADARRLSRDGVVFGRHPPQCKRDAQGGGRDGAAGVYAACCAKG